jgi:hypothetical protein
VIVTCFGSDDRDKAAAKYHRLDLWRRRCSPSVRDAESIRQDYADIGHNYIEPPPGLHRGRNC